MAKISQYLSFIKFSHTVFALPFALIGFFLGVRGGAEFSWQLFVKVILCMVFARSAAMAYNRYADRFIDEINPRTKIREIPAGVITANAAFVFVVLNSLLFVATTWFINPLCFMLSTVALLVILGYSLTKRFTALCHLVLGLGLSLAPIGAFIAVTGQFMLTPVLFSLVVLFWVSGFDIIYALQDEEFDKGEDLFSVPAKLGKKNALLVSRMLHVVCTLFLLTAGYAGHFGWLYWVGVLFFMSMLVYQHRLVKPNDLSKVNLAFATTNGVASVVFGVIVLLDIFLFK